MRHSNQSSIFRPMAAGRAALTTLATDNGTLVDLDQMRRAAAAVAATAVDPRRIRDAERLTGSKPIPELSGTGKVRLHPRYQLVSRTHLFAARPNLDMIVRVAPSAVVPADGHVLVDIDPYISVWAVIADITGDTALADAATGDVYNLVQAALNQHGHAMDREEVKKALFRWFFWPATLGAPGTARGILRDMFPAAASYSRECAQTGHDLYEIYRIHNDRMLAVTVDAWAHASAFAGARPALLRQAQLLLEVPTGTEHELIAAVRADTYRGRGPLAAQLHLTAGPSLDQLNPLDSNAAA